MSSPFSDQSHLDLMLGMQPSSVKVVVFNLGYLPGACTARRFAESIVHPCFRSRTTRAIFSVQRTGVHVLSGSLLIHCMSVRVCASRRRQNNCNDA